MSKSTYSQRRTARRCKWERCHNKAIHAISSLASPAWRGDDDG